MKPEKKIASPSVPRKGGRKRKKRGRPPAPRVQKGEGNRPSALISLKRGEKKGGGKKKGDPFLPERGEKKIREKGGCLTPLTGGGRKGKKKNDSPRKGEERGENHKEETPPSRRTEEGGGTHFHARYAREKGESMDGEEKKGTLFL